MIYLGAGEPAAQIQEAVWSTEETRGKVPPLFVPFTWKYLCSDTKNSFKCAKHNGFVHANALWLFL